MNGITIPPIPIMSPNPFTRGMQTAYVPPIEPKPEPRIRIKDPKGVKTGEYPENTIKEIIQASEHFGIDPYDTLAIALQESGLERKENTRGRGRRGVGHVMSLTPEQIEMVDAAEQKTGLPRDVLKLAVAWKGKQNPNLEKIMQYQAYNGLGILRPEQFPGGMAYGMKIPAEGLDMRKTPLYGRTIERLVGAIKSNEGINKLIKKKTNE